VPSGNGYGVVTLQVPSRGFGHGVLAYSARVEDDGTLDIGIWDNNLPNKPHTLKVLTDGTWTYDGGSVYGTVFSGALSMSASSKHDQGLLGLLPLYQPTGLSFQPGSVENSSIGGGTFVDLPPGATVSAATDDSGRPVDIEPLLADGFGPAGEIVNLPTGVGELDLTGAGSLDIRGNGVYMTADTDASGPSTLLSNEETGMISVTGASADLAVARSSLLVQSSGAQQLGLSSSNSVSFTGSGHAVTVVAAGNVDGSQVTATLYSGKPAAGTLIEVTPGRVAHAIKRAVFHVSRPTVKPGGAVRITGSTGFAGGRVALEELTHKHWRRLASVPIRHGTFSFAVKHLDAGKHTFRVARRHVHSKALVVTVP
jgi:hypothetical protein